MARPLRVEFPGAIYHVTCRMVGSWRTEKSYLFKDDADRERFLERLAERVSQYNIRLYLFVCMMICTRDALRHTLGPKTYPFVTLPSRCRQPMC